MADARINRKPEPLTEAETAARAAALVDQARRGAAAYAAWLRTAGAGMGAP